MDDRVKLLLRQIGAKIMYYRAMSGLKQEELARKAHISQSVLSRIETGSYHDTLSIPMLVHIADALGIDVSELVTFSETERRLWLRAVERRS